MTARDERIAAARAAIDRQLDQHRHLNFRMLEPEIRKIIGDPGARYEDVVEFLAACGLVVKLGTVHKFCIPRKIRPPMPVPPATPAEFGLLGALAAALEAKAPESPPAAEALPTVAHPPELAEESPPAEPNVLRRRRKPGA